MNKSIGCLGIGVDKTLYHSYLMIAVLNELASLITPNKHMYLLKTTLISSNTMPIPYIRDDSILKTETYSLLVIAT